MKINMENKDEMEKMMRENPLVHIYGAQKRWVNYRLQTVDGKVTKVPYAVTGLKASSIDPSTWSTHDEAVRVSEKVGIIFTPDQKLLGIDIDHCLREGEIVHEQKEAIAALIHEADTYTEISPSGEGLHLILIIDEPLPLLTNKKAPFECYTSARYFTVTGASFGESRPVRTVTTEEANCLLAIIGYPWGKKVQERIPRVITPLPMDDTVILDKMFTSKNSSDIKALYNGDTSKYDNDESRADLAMCAHLAYWTDKDDVRMDRIFRISKLMRSKWDEKRGNTTYGKMTIEKAIEGCCDVYTGTGKDRGFLGDGKKTFLVFENICRVLERDGKFNGILRLNDFSSMVEVCDKKSREWGLLSDEFILDAMRHVSVTYPWFVGVKKEMLTDAIRAVASQNKVNPPKEYLLSLKWDGCPRLDSWLYHAYDTPDDKIHREIGANWMKGLVRRIMHPGCQFDHVLTLESKQGWKKSTSLRTLGEPWHVEINGSPDDKDFFMILAQNVIVEFSEGDIISRTDVKKMKGIITRVKDQVRLPYARGVSTLKRGCVFAMTTNENVYLKDETGNRRWLPVKLGKIADINWILANRDQLYAEAYHRAINLRETTYEYSDEDQLTDMQESRRERNDYEEDLIVWYLGLSEEKRNNGIRAIDVFNEVLNPGAKTSSFTKEISRIVQLQITGMLRGALRLENKDVKRNGAVLKRWFATEQTHKKFNFEKHNESGHDGTDNLW